jgi:hypothetical protein
MDKDDWENIESTFKKDFKHNNKEIEVLDAIMGSGKTLGIGKWMMSNPSRRYLYVSPLLKEVEERIVRECGPLDFVSPNTEEHRTKGLHLLQLLKDKRNIAFTHSLFKEMSREHLKAIDEGDYTLIIDEEIDFIDAYNERDYKPDDIRTLEMSGHIKVDEDNLGRVIWTWEDDKYLGGAYTKLKNMCDLQMLHCTKRDRSMMVTHLPISLITVSERTIVMTYRFNGSIMQRFMEMKNIKRKVFDEVTLLKTEAEVKRQAADLIEVFRTPSTRKVSRFSLASGWYSETAKKEDLKRIEGAILSACRKGKCRDVMYTLPKHLVEKPSKSKPPKMRFPGYNYKECFLFCGIKATNEFNHKNVLVHAFNRHPLVSVSSYLQDYGFPIQADEFALSELIQWVWRSRIRNGEPIKICFLSPRMESIFTSWVDDCEPAA